MKLLGTEFGTVFNASGARNFDGHGYWYHRIFRHKYERCGFIAKTTTLIERQGNMPLRKDGITPKEWHPACIKVNIRRGEVVNAVGLSGPGARFLLESGIWQRWDKGPFMISFMSIGPNSESRLDELKRFVIMLIPYLEHFQCPVGLQINFSCPNVGLHAADLAKEVEEALEIASVLRTLNVSLIPKFNPLVPAKLVINTAKHYACDAISLTNTIPWGQTDLINWRTIFGTDESPLSDLGGGGYSGPQALPIVINLIRQCRDGGVTKPLMGGNGIQSKRDAYHVLKSGASAIELGCVAMVRPWRLQQIIDFVIARQVAQDVRLI